MGVIGDTQTHLVLDIHASQGPCPDVAEFKPGLWHLAKKRPDVELVPVYLENLNRILPKGDFILVPLLAAVTFGTPVKPQEGEDKPTFLARAREAVASLRRKADEGR